MLHTSVRQHYIISILQMATNQGIQDLNTILMVCGINNQVEYTHIIDGKHFQSLQNFCMCESDKDVDIMASHLASKTQQEGCMHLGTIVMKKLQALVFWCKDHQMHGLNLVAAEFDQAAMLKVMEGKCVQKKVKETESAPAVKDLGRWVCQFHFESMDSMQKVQER